MAAADELKSRVLRRAAAAMPDLALDRLSPMYVGTIHSYCLRFLQDRVARYATFDLDDDHRIVGLLSREYEELGLDDLGIARRTRAVREFRRYTRARRRIENEQLPAMRPEATQALHQRWVSLRPGIVARSHDTTYNCVGMVFANRRTAIDPDQLQKIFDDDGYRPLASLAEAMPGDVAVYRVGIDIAHVAVVIEVKRDFSKGTIEFLLLSKWGQAGEYIHREREVPDAYGTLTEVWSERKKA